MGFRILDFGNLLIVKVLYILSELDKIVIFFAVAVFEAIMANCSPLCLDNMGKEAEVIAQGI
jgi:hypothetical protein